MNEQLFEELRSSFKTKDKLAIETQINIIVKLPESQHYISQNTYMHPLGFYFCVLKNFKNKETFRLHFWHKDSFNIEPLMKIHNHYYTVNSFILKGSILNHVYEVVENGSQYAIYSGDYNTNGDRILKKRPTQVGIKHLRTESINTKELYHISTSDFHENEATGNFTCTFVYTEEPGIPQPIVLGPNNGMDEYYHPNRLQKPSIILSLLNLL